MQQPTLYFLNNKQDKLPFVKTGSDWYEIVVMENQFDNFKNDALTFVFSWNLLDSYPRPKYAYVRLVSTRPEQTIYFEKHVKLGKSGTGQKSIVFKNPHDSNRYLRLKFLLF